MRLIAFLFLVFLPSMLFGETYNDEWPVYVFGDTGYYKLIFDGIAMTVQDHTFMNTVFKGVFAASLVHTAVSMSRYEIGGSIWNFAAGVGLVTQLLYPTSTVHVMDVRTLEGFVADTNETGPDYSSYSKIDHIPFFIAATASLATTLKYDIIDTATTALTPIAGSSFRDSGFATPMNLADDMITVASFKYSRDNNYTAPRFEQFLSYYISECLVKNALYVDPTTIFGIMDLKGNQIEALNPGNFSAQDLNSTEIKDINGSDTTCGDYWDNHISTTEVNKVAGVLYDNLQKKNPQTHLDAMADSVAHLAGIESNASVASVAIQNAMMNVATTSTLINAIKKAGTGISGIDLSNAMAAQQSLAANMVDSTGQFKWMIKIVPVIEYLIFGMLLYLGIPMAMVAGFMGASRGGKMIMNYMFGLIAFSFIDVGLAIVQSVSYYYYSKKAAEMVIMLGNNPLTPTSLPLYIQNMGYMSGVMGWAAIIVAPLTVGVVFKGETMAAMGAYNSAMGMYKGDKGGQNLSDSLKRSAAVHSTEAQDYERYAREREDHAKRNLSDWGIPLPQGALASEMWSQVSSEAEQLGGNMGVAKLGQSKYGSLENFSQTRAKAGAGTGEMNVRKSIASGLGAAEMFSQDGVGDDFSYQTQTDMEKSIAATASKGKASQDISGLDRNNQINSAKALADKALVDEVGAGAGLMDTGAFDKNGNLLNNDAMKAMTKGAELSSLQKANMQIGTGEAGNVADYAEVALEDGQIAAKTVSATNKRRNQLDGSNGTEKWDEDKIADSQAISSVQQQIKSQGVSNALNKEGQDNADAFRQAAMGSEFSGRKEENDQLGIGN